MTSPREPARPGGQPDGLARYYQRPDLKATLEQIRRARLRLRLAMSAASAHKACLELLACWQAYAHNRTLAYLLHEQKSSDVPLAKELSFFQAADGPVQSSLALAFKAILDCRFRDDILPLIRPFHLDAALYWSQLSSERIQADCETEAVKIRELSDWMAQSRIFCLGQRWPIAALPALLESPQRSIRRATFRGILDFIRTHEEWLNRQISDLIELRGQMVKKMHLPGQFEMTRHQTGLFGVTEDQIGEFKRFVQHFFVPMGVEIRRLQRKRLNLEILSEHDLLCFLPDGHPVPTSSRDVQFHAITATLKQLLQQNRDDQVLDLTCLDLPLADFQLGPDMYGDVTACLLGPKGPVYWRLPHHGTMTDISHHLQAFGPLLAALSDQAIARSADSIAAPVLPDIARATLQASLTELAAQPNLQELIQENDLYKLLRLTQMTETLVTLTLMADFSYQIHQGNLLGPAERYALWLELEQVYLPDLEHADWPFLAQGSLQHLALEAWLVPGQSLAQAFGLFAALCVWQKNRKFPDHLGQDWARLIAKGNSLPFNQLLDTLQLPQPWDESAFKRLAYAISAELSL
ncbi:MAG: hypothetical protein EOM08_00165 [Clostridia bacterium]|nr:hypothetical protein [Clostridia bacterium]NCC74837.1 hypothetical protein [Clostridia bacterium]